ncbi:unnamed protein product [Amoebophrya sp. A120]|nr:unnamed protein product [Amoebophrya sp. A120]|eukprot:GSA120T00003417001.1
MTIMLSTAPADRDKVPNLDSGTYNAWVPTDSSRSSSSGVSNRDDDETKKRSGDKKLASAYSDSTNEAEESYVLDLYTGTSLPRVMFEVPMPSSPSSDEPAPSAVATPSTGADSMRGIPGSSSELIDDISNRGPEVYLNLYHVRLNSGLGFSVLNRLVNAFSSSATAHEPFGVYHVGVELFDMEWQYAHRPVGCGIFCLKPRVSHHHTYYRSIYLGKAKGGSFATKKDVIARIKLLQKNWPGPEYHTRTKNCLDFARVLTAELGVEDCLEKLADYARWWPF